MTERLPLFPLGTVLFPGLVLPLHIFEDRYRLLVRDLLDLPEPRRFGVVSVEPGHRAGPGDDPRFAAVGCTAVLHTVTPRDDGRFDIVTVGGRRFRIRDVDGSAPYLRAEVDFPPDGPGAEPDAVARRVVALFRRYQDRLAAFGGEPAAPFDPPGDPVRLSYLVAAAMVLDRDEKQRLLEAPDATARLRAEEDLLGRENRLLEALPTVPATGFIDGGAHPN
ncbi:peptidase S16 [Actinomadura craniellae]|uniref:Peptidase S16 n=1 Tax=Actinomadura craniellae TaxID=2231787 RepID=A0A365HC34_9ACTN|nr:LON peptidase substrate-binding domain-containing protein [Actinomadura craniellae]RAY16506.1 peptidase S16 [Actinomadura craniellae]